MQVQRASTVQSTMKNSIGKCDQKTQSGSVIDKVDAKKHNSSVGLGFGSGSKIEATWQTHNANFDALDKVNMSKQQSNNTQCTAMHSTLGSKKPC